MKPDTHKGRQYQHISKAFLEQLALGRDHGDTPGAPASKSRQRLMPVPQGRVQGRHDLAELM